MNVHAEIRLTNFALDPCCSCLVHLNYCWRYLVWQFSLVLANFVFILFLSADDYISFLFSPTNEGLIAAISPSSLILWIAFHLFIRNYWKSIGDWSDKMTWSSWVFYAHFLSRAVQFCAWQSLWKLSVNGSVKCLWFINVDPQYCIPFLKSDVTIPVGI
jgi:hypothetical protein